MPAFSSILFHNSSGIDSGLVLEEYRVYTSHALIWCRYSSTCVRFNDLWPLGISARTPSLGSPSRRTNLSEASITMNAERMVRVLPTACPEYTVSKTISPSLTFKRNPAWHELYVPFSQPGSFGWASQSRGRHRFSSSNYPFFRR